jgi:hypothetical protein
MGLKPSNKGMLRSNASPVPGSCLGLVSAPDRPGLEVTFPPDPARRLMIVDHARETPEPGGARVGGVSPKGRVYVKAGVAMAGTHMRELGMALQRDVALPIKATLTPPVNPTSAQRQQYRQDVQYILTVASTASLLGGVYGGSRGVLAGFALGGTYATIDILRSG